MKNKIKKVKQFLNTHKKILIGTSVFVLLGLVGLLIGFEIAQGWHAIRNWITSDSAVTFFIIAIVGLAVLALVVLILITLKLGDTE